MRTTNLPGFNAENSLYGTGGHYKTGSGKAWKGSRTDSDVVPQASALDCLTYCATCAGGGVVGLFYCGVCTACLDSIQAEVS